VLAMAATRLSGWFRYRLRTLLGLMTLAAVGLGGYKAYVEPYQIQRRAAEEFVKLGAQVEYRPTAPRWLRYWFGDRRLSSVVMVKLEHRRFADEELAPLADLPDLERLYLAASSVTDEGLKHVRSLRRLKRLSLWQTPITDDGMAHLAGLSELQVLDIHRTKITEVGLEHLRGHPNLVRLVYSHTFNDAGIDLLSSLPRIQIESLRCYEVGDDSLRKIAQRFPCRRLEVASRRVTDKGVLYISRIRTLEALQLSGCQATDSGIERLAALPGLSSLRVEEVALVGGCLPALAEHRSLKQIELIQTRIPFEAVARHFGSSAKQLWIHNAGARQMDHPARTDTTNASCPPSSRFILWTGELESDDIEHLAYYPEIEALDLDNRSWNIALGAGLRKLTNLRSFSLNVTMDDQGAELLGQLGQLQHLSLRGRQTMSQQGYHQLSRLRDLVSLELRSCGLTDEQLAFVADLPRLEVLQISGNPLTNVGMRHLDNLQQLRVLNVSFCPRIDDEAFAEISRLEGLEKLSAQDTRVTDAGLLHLFDMPHLRDVTVLGSKATRTGIKALRSALLTQGGTIY
jgi:hypothetical protein